MSKKLYAEMKLFREYRKPERMVCRKWNPFAGQRIRYINQIFLIIVSRITPLTEAVCAEEKK